MGPIYFMSKDLFSRIKYIIHMFASQKYLNRYIFLLDDHSRVILKPVPGDRNGSDYINASYIDVSKLLFHLSQIRDADSGGQQK